MAHGGRGEVVSDSDVLAFVSRPPFSSCEGAEAQAGHPSLRDSCCVSVSVSVSLSVLVKSRTYG